MKLATLSSAAPPAGATAAKAVPLNTLPPEMQHRIDDAISMNRLPSGDAMTEAGITQLSYRVHPSAVPVHVLDFFFTKVGERSRRQVGEWLWAEALKFTADNGIFGKLTLSGRDRFLAEIEPRLHAKGAGIEDWVKHLDASGLFKEVPGR